MTSLDSLPKGFRFPPTPVDISPDWVRQYLEATDDKASDSDTVPPMALAALAIRTLLNNARLPEGAIHAGQELECLAPVQAGQRIVVAAEIISKGERAGWQLLTVRMEVADGVGERVMTGRATLSMPVR